MLETMGLRLTTRWRASRNGQCYLKGWGLIQLSFDDLRINADTKGGQSKQNSFTCSARVRSVNDTIFSIVRFFVRFLSILQSKVFLINTLDVIRTDVFLERKIVKDGKEILRNVIDIETLRFEFLADNVTIRIRYYHRSFNYFLFINNNKKVSKIRIRFSSFLNS